MTNKVAMVMGGARGIGYASCRRLAKDCDAIAIVDINGTRAAEAARMLQEETGTRTLGFAADAGKREELVRVRREINEALGAPTVLVNCAAIVDDKLFLESTPEDWERVLSVCLYGTMHTLHEFLPDMVAAGYGRVVCLASDSARLGQARLSYYAAAKGAVLALVKSIAQELGKSGVTLNVVSPGATNTEMRQAREQQLAAAMGPEKYERRQKSVLKAYPLGRLGEPDDVAAAVHFLTTDDASWITGQVLSVNGGWSMA
jgi:NAD(P)-dependent dehydrogenase (short-subunit alcohol dehydrogenase family)